ncbi:hypothetical protein EYC80_003830 [Monilinia laxa]|uniref:Uncharacterized protein n=1 Tax=Monilinia laxa TaxID=61186 RepID=A0A5N6KL59_MONLA|nr:hypothetical protein EYC80_003830 [Monilinia laxa]
MSQAKTNYRTQMPQSQDFQHYHDAPDEPENNNVLQPEEWEDYDEDTGVTSPLHKADADPHLHHCPSLDSLATTLSTHKSQPLTDSHTNLIPTSSSSSYDSRTQSPTITTTSSSTNRIVRLQPRGVHYFNPAANKNWLEILQAYLSYTFKDPDILEEALEEPNNGVTRVGITMRICMDGNEGMSRLGESVIKLVLSEQYCLFSIPEGRFVSSFTLSIFDSEQLY